LLEHYFGLIEALFVFGLAIAFYVWQMRDLKKENARAKARAAADNTSAPAEIRQPDAKRDAAS
jgi:Flp pilus assembly protein TadB